MDNNKNDETSVTYSTTEHLWVRQEDTPWQKIGQLSSIFFENASNSLVDLGEAAFESSSAIEKYAAVAFTLHNPSVGYIALIHGISKRYARELMGYTTRKPLIHKGKKP